MSDELVDDATTTTCCRLGEQETIWAAVGVLRSWIGKYGVPRALYTDWKNVYKRQPTERERLRGKAPTTQFGRMCERLEIGIIAASSPQAKGRVERNNGVQQDRLVKKLRRQGIASYEAANEYLEAAYLAEHHRRFARAAARAEDYHVRAPSAAKLREVFRLETERWISNDWVVQYRGHFLQLKPQNKRYGPTQAKALVCEWEDGAILAGERDPQMLAKLRDWRIKATKSTIAKSLVGDYRREHLFTLGQSLAAYRHYQKLIDACDKEIEQYLETFESKVDPPEDAKWKSQDGQKTRGDRPRFDLQSHLYRIFGVDLTQIPGVHTLTTQTLLAEIGPDLSRFASGAAFTSWLGLCPDNRISGGKILSVKTRKVKNRAATALRLAAQSLYRSQSYLGHYFRRMRAKLGAPKAITAAAHKLARIIYHMVTTRQAYHETICVQNEVQNRQRLEARLRKQARDLGLEIIPAKAGAV